MTRYPFVPKSTKTLSPGDFWSVPLIDGSFCCGKVLQLPSDGTVGARVSFYGALLDWRDDRPPTTSAIDGRRSIEQGVMHLNAIREISGQILGTAGVHLDEIVVSINGSDIQKGYERIRTFVLGDQLDLPSFSYWGWNYIWLQANYHFLETDLPYDAEPKTWANLS